MATSLPFVQRGATGVRQRQQGSTCVIWYEMASAAESAALVKSARMVLMKFDFKSLPPGTMFFDWNSVPVTVSPDWRSATAWGPDPEPRNPSDVREKADPVDKAEFKRVFDEFAALIANAAKPSSRPQPWCGSRLLKKT